jgi:methionyl-tRNA synthetase
MNTEKSYYNPLICIYLRTKYARHDLALAARMICVKMPLPMVSIKDFQQLEIRIAEVLDAQPHPNADRLYVLKVKVGETEKQIIAGIRPSYAADQLVGKKVVVINNLEPAVIRGVESQGMLLAASDDKGHSVLTPDRDVPSGAQVR